MTLHMLGHKPFCINNFDFQTKDKPRNAQKLVSL